jgi:D-3-phosphoglycerate dehydrogenase / 2-oxoglutarate reductase
MPKVLIAPAHLAKLDGDFIQVLRRAGLELVYANTPAQMTEPELLAKLGGVSASLAGGEPYTRRVIESAPDLKVIARVGVGYDAVDVEAATEHGVVVTIAPGTNQDAVAEHTFMLILALAKNLLRQDPAIREGKWPRRPNEPLRGRTIGLVGLGRIGKAVATRGIAFGMRVIAFEPYPDKAFAEKHQIKLLPLPDVLREADYVSLHLPATAETRNLIDQKTLALMKPTAYLINTARGAIIDEAALCAALKEKRIAGAGLDVFEPEPPCGSDICRFENVVLTAHTAGVDHQSLNDMARLGAEAIARLWQGEWPAELIVNPEVRERFRWGR